MKITGTAGHNNTFTEVNIDNVENYNPNVKEVTTTIITDDGEYIRKDTLLDWLERKKKLFESAADGSSDSHYFSSKVIFAQEVIDKVKNL